MSASSVTPRAGSLGRPGRPARRRAPRWLAIPLGACIALGGYGAWQYTQSSAAATVTTTTATVSRGALTASVSGSGTVAAASSRTLSFPVSGTVSEVLVVVGDSVTAGQALARLDAAELELAVQQAQANLKSAQAQLAAAEAAVRQAELSLQSQRASLAAAKAKAESQVTTAANALRDAQDSYSTIYWQNRELDKMPGDLPQTNVDEEAAAQRAVANAEESLRQAQVAYEQAKQDAIIGIQQAEATIT